MCLLQVIWDFNLHTSIISNPLNRDMTMAMTIPIQTAFEKGHDESKIMVTLNILIIKLPKNHSHIYYQSISIFQRTSSNMHKHYFQIFAPCNSFFICTDRIVHLDFDFFESISPSTSPILSLNLFLT